MKKKLTNQWFHYMGIGGHALMAALISLWGAQLLYTGASLAFETLIGKKNDLAWLKICLSIFFFVLVSLPLFGFFFSKLYPKTDVAPDDSDSELGSANLSEQV